MAKRIFAVLLAVMLVWGMLPVHALSVQLPETTASTEETAEATTVSTEETAEATEETTVSTEETTEATEETTVSTEETTEATEETTVSAEETTEATEETTAFTEAITEVTEEAPVPITEPIPEPKPAEAEAVFREAGDYLTNRGTPTVGSIGGEWAVIGLSRAGRQVPGGYYDNVLSFVQTNINPDTNRLNRNKSTENSRVILALTALGYDVTNVAGYDLLAGLDQMTYLRKQGVNGPIWALMAFDSHDYAIPEGDVTREGLIRYILDKQLSDGGWALSGSTSDPDMTGMALTALAPYRASDPAVSTAVDKALSYLSKVQTPAGGYVSSGDLNSESIAQVLVALTALGIDPDSDSRFIKNGITLLDALCTYAVEGGGFAHILGQGRDEMATEQGYYALTAYFRLKAGKSALFDMSDVTITQGGSHRFYKITAGANSTWISGETSLRIASDGPLAEFTGVTLNEMPVEAGNYTLDGEKTALTFSADYLETLPSGQYTLTLLFADRKASTSLTIVDGEDAAAAVAEVESLIDAIGTVTKNSEEKIEAARDAYDALPVSLQARVENYDTLQEAEKALAELADKITVTFSVLGDRAHDSDSDGSVHTLAAGNLTTWAGAKKYTVKKDSTVRTVLELVLAQSGMSCSNPTGNYVESITKGGVTIGEFTNGQNSGWMYTLNGTHPNLGVNQQKLKDGDVVIFHYTDDFTQEEGSRQYTKVTVQEVEDLIDAIGEPITLESEAKITAARKAYEKLTDAQKAQVENYALLVAAEKALAELKAGVDGDLYQITGDYLENLGTPNVGAIGGEWMVIGLARSGRAVPEGYYENVLSYVAQNIDENQRLHRAKSTENARLILALTAIGKDVTDVDGHNLLLGLTDMDYVRKQGINGPIWALIAFDSGNYPIPEGNVTRSALLDVILAAQLADGGWTLSGDTADPDMTSMALQALAPYCKTDIRVRNAADKALSLLSQIQDDNGGYSSIDGPSSESIAQVIVALTALGIDPDTDARFVKNDLSAVDALLAYFVEGGGFRHIPEGQLDGMATEQAYYALTAYHRFQNGETALYDMTDIIDLGGDGEPEISQPRSLTTEAAAEEEAASGGYPLWCVLLSFAAGVAVGLVLPMLKRKLVK